MQEKIKIFREDTTLKLQNKINRFLDDDNIIWIEGAFTIDSVDGIMYTYALLYNDWTDEKQISPKKKIGYKYRRRKK